MVQIVALAVVMVARWIGPRLWAHVLALGGCGELLRELLQQHELVEVLLPVHLLGLSRPSVEATELLQVVAAAVHVLKLLVGELVHADSVGYVGLWAECAVRNEASHPRIAH